MSSETFTYKGISAGKYIEGEIEAINQEEASFKLKEQKMEEINSKVETQNQTVIEEKSSQEQLVSQVKNLEKEIKNKEKSKIDGLVLLSRKMN